MAKLSEQSHLHSAIAAEARGTEERRDTSRFSHISRSSMSPTVEEQPSDGSSDDDVQGPIPGGVDFYCWFEEDRNEYYEYFIHYPSDNRPLGYRRQGGDGKIICLIPDNRSNYRKIVESIFIDVNGNLKPGRSEYTIPAFTSSASTMTLELRGHSVEVVKAAITAKLQETTNYARQAPIGRFGQKEAAWKVDMKRGIEASRVWYRSIQYLLPWMNTWESERNLSRCGYPYKEIGKRVNVAGENEVLVKWDPTWERKSHVDDGDGNHGNIEKLLVPFYRKHPQNFARDALVDKSLAHLHPLVDISKKRSSVGNDAQETAAAGTKRPCMDETIRAEEGRASD